MQKTLHHKLRYNGCNPNHQCCQRKDPLETLIELVDFFFLSSVYSWIYVDNCWDQ